MPQTTLYIPTESPTHLTVVVVKQKLHMSNSKQIRVIRQTIHEVPRSQMDDGKINTEEEAEYESAQKRGATSYS